MVGQRNKRRKFELFVLDKPELKRNYVSAIKDTVLLRDIFSVIV